ncbi:MAG: biotin/lipoyl-containing protein [Bacteroidales bacterium]
MKEYNLTINGNEYKVAIVNQEETIAEIEVNGTPFKVEIERKAVKKSASIVRPVSNKPAKVEATVARPSSSACETTVTSPLPGVILDIAVKEGDSVKKGEKLLVLEAMKMENVIEATVDGTVTAVKAIKGDSVLEGTPLIIIG